MTLSDFLLIILGIILSLILYKGADKRHEEDLLDDWDQQDQLEETK